jgi:hypothetical protein
MLVLKINPLQNNNAIQRLTALWALSESGLGGMMFALKIPFTGFFVGGFAVIVLGLIAHFSNNNYRQIIQSTIIVLMVKAAVSPHSPPPAYLAVAFQGFTAALLFSIISSYKTACILLGMITMAESAIQKIIILTILFGKKLWEAIDALFVQISKEFSLDVHRDYSLWLIGIFIIFYIIWGAIVGSWAYKIPEYIFHTKEYVLDDYAQINKEGMSIKIKTKSHRTQKKIFSFIGVTIFIVSVFLLNEAGGKTVWWILARSIAVLLLIYYVLLPISKFIIQKWLSNRQGVQKKATEEIIILLPKMNRLAGIAFTMAGNEPNYFKRLRKFILYLIILSLYAEQPQ